MNKKNTLVDRLENKVVVVDTSSLLNAGVELLKSLKNCDLVIPTVVVQELEEKRTHQRLGFISREWLRLIEELRVKTPYHLKSGVQLKECDNVKLRIEPNHVNQSILPKNLQDGSVDSTILSVAKNLSKEFEQEKKDPVVLLSNDMPMRLHAGIELGLTAYEYSNQSIHGSEEPFNGKYVIDLDDDEANSYYSQKDLRSFIFSHLPVDCAENCMVKVNLGWNKQDYFILHGDKVTPLKRKAKAIKAMGVVGRTVEQDAALAYLQDDDVKIVSLGGAAGTGKTLLTLATGLQSITKYKKFDKMIVFRSLHEMGVGQELGFLPGTVDEKMSNWGGAIWDNLEVLAKKRSQDSREELINKWKQVLEISPITYLRGRSLDNSFILVEEAQNFSRTELLNILSRVGENSKIVFTFDAAQVDNRFLRSGAGSDMWSVVDDLKSEDLFAHITLRVTERSRIAELAARLLENSED